MEDIGKIWTWWQRLGHAAMTAHDLKIAAIHCGAHLIVWTSQAGRTSDRTQLEMTAAHGVRLVLAGWREDWAALRGTLFATACDLVLGAQQPQSAQ
ncbi:hypothetical protein HK105_207387 [Polyrhizophydium stewartii]|uniref:Uncharacterized protein n=1 Tax=Polyrhizophydium stewartii TaxID=2732419 RepID=A0ABR4N0U2_9FUNG|nr:hypothetical protein HK105_002561 [Polyrhizophydium stewartii]